MGAVSYTPCDENRQDDPRFAYGESTFDPAPGTWAPECGHAACIEDDERHPTFHGWDCPVAECRWNTARDACQGDAGHAGEHVFALPLPEAPERGSAGGGHG